MAKNTKIDATGSGDREKKYHPCVLAVVGQRAGGGEGERVRSRRSRGAARDRRTSTGKHDTRGVYKSALRIFRHFLLLTRYNLN